MQKGKLDAPPGTVTSEFHVKLKRPTPSTAPLRHAKVASPAIAWSSRPRSSGKVTSTCRGLFVAVREGLPPMELGAELRAGTRRAPLLRDGSKIPPRRRPDAQTFSRSGGSDLEEPRDRLHRGPDPCMRSTEIAAVHPTAACRDRGLEAARSGKPAMRSRKIGPPESRSSVMNALVAPASFARARARARRCSARDERSDPDRRLDPLRAAQRLEALEGEGAPGSIPRDFREERDRDRHRRPGRAPFASTSRSRRTRALRDQRDRIPVLEADLEAPASARKLFSSGW